MNIIRVKICGIRELETALVAVDYGVDALGFVFYPPSPRSILPLEASKIISKIPCFINKVGVFVEQGIEDILHIVVEAGLDTIQLHGESELYNRDFITKLKEKTGLPVLYGVRVEELNQSITDYDWDGIANLLVDKKKSGIYGGSGERVAIGNIDEQTQVFIRKRVILAGGINPDNVSDILSQIEPYGIDVSSGVESHKGVKDPQLIKSLLTKLK